MPAVALADVLIGDAHPTVSLRLRDHPLDQTAIGLLGVGSARKLGLGVAQAQGERVADPLQLTGVEQARAANRSDAPFQALPWERRGEQLPEPALDLGDLTAQILAGPALRGFADPEAERCPGR